MSLIRKFFPSYNDRKVFKIRERVEEINNIFADYEKTQIDPVLKTAEFKSRIEDGETLDGILPEAFALVKYVMKSLYEAKHSYSYEDMHFIWDMIPYDVQLIGGIALHQGTIVEMATGEGKTLVAVMPLYLNSLAGKGAYLVTVNDYLAKRDRAWMRPVYDRLGVDTGLIQTGMTPLERRENYNKDIVYVTNNEFGFDYLRDNLAYQKKEKVHRDEFFFGIIDEVDSVLIDEARTPLIISGLPFDDEDKEKTQKIYSMLNVSVNEFVRKQKTIVRDIFNKSKKLYDEGKIEQGIMGFLSVKRGFPKMRELLDIMQKTEMLREMENVENALIRDKELHKLDTELLFSIDERSHSVNITDKGEGVFSKIKNNDEFFLLPHLSIEIERINNDESIDENQKSQQKQDIMNLYAEKSEYIHSVHQLLKAYTLFEKDVEYIIQDNKIIIVDEHTGRLMPGRRFSEGIHSAIEAKENVNIEEETKTLAAITLQNLFRMFIKLSGMTGTAETEAKEFMHIYKLPVIVIPTNRTVIRNDYNDVLFIKKEDKTKFIADKILNLHNAGIPMLVGTASVQSSEYLDGRIKNLKDISGKNLKYNILNAKNHEREAQIVMDAGKQGAITIATNMAGRGTDIKLKPEIHMLPERSFLIQALKCREKNIKCVVVCNDKISKEYMEMWLKDDDYLKDKALYFSFASENEKIHILLKDEFSAERYREYFVIEIPSVEKKKQRNVCIKINDKGECVEFAAAGLFVLGTEKHESRRIDRQLRGRSGRQGDPGSSLFTVSLEDDLMRIFGADRMSAVINRMESMGGENTVVSHKFLTQSIENAQKKIENLNFERRKFLLEYDDVINKQREVVYELRDYFLEIMPPFEFLNQEAFKNICVNIYSILKDILNRNNVIEFKKHFKNINHIFQIQMDEKKFKDAVIKSNLEEYIRSIVIENCKQGLTSIKNYIAENIAPIASDYVYDKIKDYRFPEEWPLNEINDFLMTYFRVSFDKIDENADSKSFLDDVENAVLKSIEERMKMDDDFIDKLTYTISLSFIRAIDREWIEQLYEIEAVKEGINLRGYAQKDPIVEFKKEAYVLFSDLMDKIFTSFIKSFFESKLLDDIKEIQKNNLMAQKNERFFSSGDEAEVKKKPIEKQIQPGRNDPCPCGSGKKYKKCCGKIS